MKTALTLAAALAGLVVAAPNALGGDQPQGLTFITDTLGGTQVALNPTAPDVRQTDPRAAGPVPDATGIRFITDTLGGDGHPAVVNGYRIITDTLGGNGGASVVVAASTPAPGFSWADAAVGAATAAGSILVLVSGTLIALRRRGRLAL